MGITARWSPLDDWSDKAFTVPPSNLPTRIVIRAAPDNRCPPGFREFGRLAGMLVVWRASRPRDGAEVADPSLLPFAPLPE